MTPWTEACQASLSFPISRSLLKLMFIESVIPSNHLVLCHPLLLLPSIFPSIISQTGPSFFKDLASPPLFSPCIRSRTALVLEPPSSRVAQLASWDPKACTQQVCTRPGCCFLCWAVWLTCLTQRGQVSAFLHIQPVIKNILVGTSPGCLVVRTSHFYCRGLRFYPWLGN